MQTRFGYYSRESQMRFKELPVFSETRVWSLGQEQSLEEGMATHSSVLAWRIPDPGIE